MMISDDKINIDLYCPFSLLKRRYWDSINIGRNFNIEKNYQLFQHALAHTNFESFKRLTKMSRWWINPLSYEENVPINFSAAFLITGK